MNKNFNPITFDPVEILLKNSALAKVLAQVKFPTITSIEKQDFIASFQETIRSNYPILKKENTQGIIMGPSGIAALQNQLIWRFKSEDGNWIVSLAPDFITLETLSYTTRTDFISKFETILKAVHEQFDPKVVERIGIRYVNRIPLENATELKKLIKPEITGLIGSEIQEGLNHSITESLFTINKSQLLIKSGLLQPNNVFDPSILAPIEKLSWFLDLDMFLLENQKFSSDSLSKQLEEYAKRIYAFFRWSVKDEFIISRGGEI